MTDLVTYMSEWNVAEREHESRLRHMEKRTGATGCVDAAPDAEPAPLNRASATAVWDDSSLVAASAMGDVEWVNELLAEGADVNEFSSGSYEYSPLIVAAQKGHVEIVRILLQTGACDLTKKHMEYISALDSALHGYCNLEGCEDEFSPEIRAMIIRAHMETADRIDLNTLLHIEASGAVVPEHIRAFRSGLGARMTKVYSKKLPGKLNLGNPPAAKMPSIIFAAENAARRIMAEKAAAEAVAAGKALKMKKIAGPSVAPARYDVVVVRAGAGDRADADDEDDAERHPMLRRKTVDAYDPSLDDKYGKMSRSFKF